MEILPSSQYADPSFALRGGVLLALVPSTQPGFGVELQRTSDIGGGLPASSAALSIAELNPVKLAGAPFLDALPVDNALRFYRGRHISDGWTASLNWTAWTSGHYPLQLSEKDISLAIGDQLVYPVLRSEPMTDRNYAVSAADPVGRQPSSHLYMPSTQFFRVGTAAASSYIYKPYDVDYSLFEVRAAAALTKADGYLSFTSSGGQTIGAGLGAVPTGAQLISSTALTALVLLATSQEAGVVQLTLVGRHSTDPANMTALIGGLIAVPATSAIGNWYEIEGLGGVTVTLGGSSYSSYEVRYLVASTNPTASRLARMRVRYAMPSYEVGR